MKFRSMARTKDEATMGKLIDLMGNDKGTLEFDVDYQFTTEAFVFDIKTQSKDCFDRVNGYIKSLGIEDTKSVGIVGQQ